MSWKIPVCDGCHRENPLQIILKDEIWKSIAPVFVRGRGRGILCLKCIETRLDRKITLDDLKPCGITDIMLFGYQIGTGQTDGSDVGFS